MATKRKGPGNIEREAPVERFETIRHYIAALLEEGTYSAKDLSNIIRIPEREICDHLEHLQKTFGKSNKQLEITPAACGHCGFTFRKRGRLTKPGKCPTCRYIHIRPPLFRIKTV